jgi:macrolide transport system ATP-binding/permease protein
MLSGGQQQRVALARALVNRPMLVLADEPTGALDRESGEEVLKLLAHLTRAEGVTLMVATHSEQVCRQADRVIALQDGQIVRDQRLKETTFVAERRVNS